MGQAFESGWSVLKAPLDLDSVRQVEPDVYHADHYDKQGVRFPLEARVGHEGSGEFFAFTNEEDRNNVKDAVGSLYVLPWGELTDVRSDAAYRHIMRRMGLDKLLAELDEDELDELEDMRMDYSSGSDLEVARNYQRRGIATALRDLLSEINDRYLRGAADPVDDRPDPKQTDDAQVLWAANQNDPNYRDRLHEIAWRGLRERMGDAQ